MAGVLRENDGGCIQRECGVVLALIAGHRDDAVGSFR